MYFKSLSGDITSISISSLIYPEDDYFSLTKAQICNTWNRIISIIASENNCEDCQVVIFDDESYDEKSLEPPLLAPEKQYNFLIRDLKYFQDYFSVNIIYGIDEDVSRFLIEIYTEQEDFRGIYQFYVYEEERSEGNTYFLEKGKDETFSMYEILCNKDLPVPWYDRQHMIDRIMERYDDIIIFSRSRSSIDEDW